MPVQATSDEIDSIINKQRRCQSPVQLDAKYGSPSLLCTH